MYIQRPLTKKEVIFDKEERSHIRCVLNLLEHIFTEMNLFDVLLIEDNDDIEYPYHKDTLLDEIRFIQHLLDFVYIQEGDEEDE